MVVDASGHPGGFRAEDCDHIVLANLTIQQAGSAAITVEQGQYHQFRNLYIHHNQGGMVVRGINSMLISNCVFAWNERDLDGGALYMEESTGDLINCVMYHNVTQGLGGGVACLYSGMLRVMNCILWNNVAGVICPDIYGSAIPVIVVTYTDITQGWTGLGNITLDPEFQDTTEFLADFHLRTGSPCIDAGNPAPEYNDPDGSRNDMGVYGGPWGEGWVGVGGGYWSSAVPQDFGIVSLYPNPANPNAMIQYRIPVQGHVRLQVYNVLGQEVTIVIDQPQSAGEYSVVVGSEEFASGVYFCRLHCDMPGGIRQISARKLLILR
ncbi:hypothetical protein AMJ86_03215 [bacterium SM23_57]|nr:MAG: hypothetical protein AMJ86_03215 [bacterium SM23_57]